MGGTVEDTALCCMPPSGRSGRFPALPYIVTRDPGHGARATIWRWYYTHSCCCLKALNPKELQGLFLISPPTFLELSHFKIPANFFFPWDPLVVLRYCSRFIAE